MKFKAISSFFASGSASASAPAPTEDKGESSDKLTGRTLHDLYQRSVQKLGLGNISNTGKRWLKIVGIVLACLLLILIALPVFINVNSFRPKIEVEATNALGRPVTLGKLSLSVLSGTLGVENISIADDPAFSQSPFVTAKSLRIGAELMPLIFSKQLNVTNIVLDRPQITLLKAANGKWNFSSLGGNNIKGLPNQEKSGASAPQNFSVAKLEIKDGQVNIGKANSTAKPQMYDNLSVKVTDFSLTSQFPFELRAGLPGGGKVDISGNAGPINPQDAASTPLDTAIKVSDMDLARSGFIDQGSGIGGQVDFDATLNSNGSQAKVAGLLTCDKLKLSPKGSPAPKRVTINYTVDADLNKQAGSIEKGQIAIGKAVAQLSGEFQTRGESQLLKLKFSAPGMPVNELEAMLPALGVVLPSGSQLQGGTLSADLSITGAVEKPVISGPVRLANTKLAGFDLGSKLGALSSFTGKAASSRDTSIENASLNARVAPEGTRADTINVRVPAIGVITGAGTISPTGAVDFRMIADLQGVAGGLTERVGRNNASRGGIPFSIQGTTSDPRFVPDVAGVAGSVARGAVQNAVSGKSSGLGGVIRRKRP